MMSNRVSNAARCSSWWDQAVRDAESEIRLLARNMARLRQAVRIFKANKRDGVAWPGSEQMKKKRIFGQNG